MNDKRQKDPLELAFELVEEGEARREGLEGTESLTAKDGNESLAEDQLMEEVLSRENLRKALERVQVNKGSPGVDRMSVARLSGSSPETLAEIPRTTARWPLPPPAGTPQGDTETGRGRNATTGYSDSTGSIYTTSATSSASGTMGRKFLGTQLWLSSEPQRAPSSSRSPTIYS